MDDTAHQRSRTTSDLPGWTEILAGLAVMALISFGTPPLLRAADVDPGTYGLALTALSGVAGIAAFLVAASLRVRSFEAFGVRRTSWRWLLVGIGGGLLAWLLSRLATVAYVAVFGMPDNVQAVYNDAARGGLLSLVLSTLFLALLTPIGEELIFRGVVTSALLRYGPIIGVVGSAVIFALFHGINIVLVTAFIVGLINAELRRRSGSVWPGVTVHIVNNLLANLIAAFLT